ncbi:hypothetical protein CR513_39828, partial [Mucuna pruriens]
MRRLEGEWQRLSTEMRRPMRLCAKTTRNPEGRTHRSKKRYELRSLPSHQGISSSFQQTSKPSPSLQISWSLRSSHSIDPKTQSST